MHIQDVSLHVGSECFKVRHSEVITFKLFLHGCKQVHMSPMDSTEAQTNVVISYIRSQSYPY